MNTLKTWAARARREAWNGFVVAFWVSFCAAVVAGFLSWFAVLPSIGLLWVAGVLR